MNACLRPLRPLRMALLMAAVFGTMLAHGQASDADNRPTPIQNSAMDAPLFYELLIGEVEFHSGQAANGFEVVLNAARRTRDESLFRRAADMAVRAHSADRVLQAARAWRQAFPRSTEPLRLQVQVLLATQRLAEAAEPLRTLLVMLPERDRNTLLPALPAWVQRAAEGKPGQTLVEQALQPYLEAPATRTAARVAMGRSALLAGQPASAMNWARQAQADGADSPLPAALALELVREAPAAEELVRAYLKRPNASQDIRLAYGRMLAGQQRHALATEQFQRVTQDQPDLAAAWLSLGALQLEQRQPLPARQAFDQYLKLAQAKPSASEEGADTEDDANAHQQRLNQVYLMQAQAAEQLGELAAAEQWLGKVAGAQQALDVQVRRAGMLARQGKVEQARALIRSAQETGPDDTRAKILAEAQILRDARQWAPALELLRNASRQQPDDLDLLYEQAMVAEKLGDLPQMESLLKQVIAAKPDHAHAYNALGYSLADRNERLEEARALIQRALKLLPKDPFITDSLGWVEFRMGNLPEATRLLSEAYAARPDAEIGTHLGEVLWAAGQRDEALRIWREARGRDATNDTLRDTLARLKVAL
jgi:tetratricopeptide (TPR) repeat protein